jgi:hypothetical protein
MKTFRGFFRRIRNIPDDKTRDILKHWMDLELEECKADDACLLSETIRAAILFSLDNISHTTTYFLVRDILRARGHDVSQIKIRSIREGIARYLYRSDDCNVSSPELELALVVTRQFHEHRDSERRNMIQSVLSTLQKDKLTLHGQADDNKKADVDAPLYKDRFTARSGPPDDGDHEDEKSADNKNDVANFPTSSGRMREGINDSPSRIVRDPSVATVSASREVQAISSAFKSSNSKFSGDLDENITKYLREYDAECRNLSLSPGRNFDLLDNLFRDDAKEWFFENIAEILRTLLVVTRVLQICLKPSITHVRARSELSKF